MPQRPPLRVTLAVGLVAACTLAMQVLLSRVFSAALFYHFAFFSISLALLGTGGGALLVYVRPNWFSRRPVESVLARWSLVLALALVAVPAVLVRLDYGVSITIKFSLVVTLTIAALLAAIPFLAAGIVIALAIKTYMASVGRVYAFDLAGAALGAVVVVPLLRLESAPTLLVALGVVAGVAAQLFAGRAPGPERRLGAAAVVLSVGLAILAADTSAYHLEAPFVHEFGFKVKGDRWTPISRVVGYAPKTGHPPSLTYDQDFAPVPFHSRGAPPPDWRSLELGPQSIGYALTGPGHALVIGGGGGRDIYNALSQRQRVDVIELNQGIVDVVDKDLRRWSGAPYTLPNVHTAVGDGRSTLAARKTKYDTVHIGFTNTLTANLGAAYALSENNLYTVEAFEEYLDHLRPNGVLSISRPYRFTGEEALRATLLSLEALRRRGVRNPQRNVVVILGAAHVGPFGTVLTRLRPYTPRELALIRRLAAVRSGRQPSGVVFAPGGPNRLEWRGLVGKTPAQFCRNYRSNVCPPTDDQPFFLNPTRLRDLFGAAPPGATFLSRTPFYILLAVLGIVAVLSLGAFGLPLWLVRDADRPPVGSLLYFAAIGVGYLVLEIVLIQRFVLLLGFPTYALSIVLFSLLLSTGAGAWLSARWRDPRRGLVVSLAGVCVLIAVLAFALEPLIHALIGHAFALRVLVAVAVLAPAGILMGMAMPIGLRRLEGLHHAGVPWAWAINGFASVAASVLALIVAIVWGFEVTTLVALACYLAALVHAARGRWPASL